MSSWDWPQWLLAGVWSFWFLVGMFMMLANHKIDHAKFAYSTINVASLIFILYMGGFWS